MTGRGRVVRAVGTAFEVDLASRATSFRVSLLQGKVRVRGLQGEGEAVELSPGEVLTLDPANRAHVERGDVERATAWREGRLVQADETLGEAVAELNRHGGPRIVLQGAARRLRVTGTFSSDDPETFARAAAVLHDLVLRQAADGAIILARAMTPARRRTSRAHLAAACAALLICAAAGGTAVAGSPRQVVDIPPGPLATALLAYARQQQADVLFSPEAVAGLRSGGLQGAPDPETALRRLVRGTGLQVRRIGPNAFVVAAAAKPRPPVARPATFMAGAAPPGVDEVVVQARRRDERLLDVPASVATVSPRALERLVGDGVMALNQAALGLTVASQLSQDTPTLVIRGQRRATAGESALSVITYLNEAPLPNGASILPLFDIGDVQVLRGPQGVLFGRNTTGGGVLIRTVEPGQETGYVRAAVGGHRLRQLELAGGLGSPDGVWAARVAAYLVRRDGLVENLGLGRDLDDRRQAALRLSVAYRPAGRFSALAIYDDFRADETGNANILLGVYPNPPDVLGGGAARTAAATPFFDCGGAGCDIDIALAEQQGLGPRRTRVDLAPRSDRRNRGVTARLDWAARQFQVRSVTAYRRTFLDTALDSDGSLLALNQASTRASVRQFTQEVRVSGQPGTAGWQAGVFYLSNAPIGVQRVKRALAMTPFNPAQLEFQYRRAESVAGFVEVTASIGRRWELDVGFRYTWDDAKACIARTVAPAADVSETGCGPAIRVGTSAPTWTAALTYRPTDDVTAYLVSRRAYRAGGVNAPLFPGDLAKHQAYDPEKLTDVEAGLKLAHTFGGWRGQLDLAIYRGWSKDIQRAVFPPTNFDGDGVVANNPTNLILNAGSAEIRGLEIGLRAQFGDRLDLSMSSALTDARFTSLTIPAALAALAPTDPDRLRFSYTPPFTIGARAEWTAVASAKYGVWRIWGDAFQSGHVAYVERARDTNGAQKSYRLVNVGVIVEPPGRDGLELSVSIDNLFDTTYAAGGGSVTPANTGTTLIYGDPRLWRVGLKARF